MSDQQQSDGGGGGSSIKLLRTPPCREDWWSEDATETLIEAWGDRYLKLNRGNLRQKDWKEVADAVNSRHHRRNGGGSGRPKTDVQCKNRIDTLKKKYKTEKAKTTASQSSKWRFFHRLDSLIGPVVKKPNASVATVRSVASPPDPSNSTDSSLDDDENDEDDWGFVARKRRRDEAGVDLSDGDACQELARAILKFGEVYERMESAKQVRMMELEKERMEIAKEVELQRMNMLMEMQLELEKSRRRGKHDAVSGKKS